MSVDLKNTWRIIFTSLKNHETSSAYFIDSINDAWLELRARRREPGGSLDLDLAAAEHYLFARWCVASGNVSEGQMTNLARLYYHKKKWDAFWGDPNKEATTANPVSKPDRWVMNFGIYGAKEGAVDHAAHKVAMTPPVWRPVSEIVGDRGFYASAGTEYSTP